MLKIRQNSGSSWFEENVRVFTEKEKVQAEWCESDSQVSECVNEQSPEKFNSTTSSFLDIIEEMSSNLAKAKSDDEKIQWLSWNMSNTMSVNDIIDELWLYVNGEWKFENDMRAKLSE